MDAMSDPVPGGAEVIALEVAKFENLALQQHPVPQPERRDIPVGARTMPDRPWMKIPR
jgi:hypothetical protein